VIEDNALPQNVNALTCRKLEQLLNNTDASDLQYWKLPLPRFETDAGISISLRLLVSNAKSPIFVSREELSKQTD
jgi:hypothetical protein